MMEFIFSEFIATMPFRLFAYLPFRDHLKVKKSVLLMILFLAELISLMIAVFLMYIGVGVGYANLVFLPISIPIFFLMVRMEKGKVAFMYVFTMAYVLIIRGVAGYFSQIIFLKANGTWQFGVVIIVMFFITLPFMAFYINRMAKKVFEIEVPGVWKSAWKLPLFSQLLVLIFTHGRQYNFMSLMIRIIMMGAVFQSCYFVVAAVHSFQKQLENEEHIKRLEEISTIQSNQYAMIQARIEETKRARHDLRQHLMVIQCCINSGDMETLANYVQEYGSSLPSETIGTFCKNFVVDAVLRYYAEQAAAEGIEITVSFQMDKEAIIPEPMLCVLLGNLLENALYACKELKENRFIRVNARQTGKSMLCIAIDNSGREPIQNNGHLISTKQDGMGTGTESVRLIAEKYNGEARYTWKDGVFYASVILNP